MMWYGNDDRNTTALTTVTASTWREGEMAIRFRDMHRDSID